jgi:hypothetical protein
MSRPVVFLRTPGLSAELSKSPATGAVGGGMSTPMIWFVVPGIVASAAAASLTLFVFGSGTFATPTAAVSGRVTASPTCPVERPNHPCAPAPVSATVQATNSRGKVVASTHTDAKGRYDLQLRVGSYTLAAVTPNIFPRCSPVSVTVSGPGLTRADIACDTGIR